MKEDQLVAAQELSKLTKMQNMRSDWEKSTDRKLQANAVRRRVQGLLHDTKFTLEARRQRYCASIGWISMVSLHRILSTNLHHFHPLI